MAQIRVNPTRMELKKLKNKYATSRRGHKLLKDKRDELMKRFLEVVREDRRVRASVEERLRAYYASFTAAGAVGNPRILEEALLAPTGEAAVNVDLTNLMSVEVPKFDGGDIEVGINYGLAFTPPGLDAALEELSDLARDMVKLAELEKTVSLLAAEIERTRRRVNALEYILMPGYLDAIKSISMKLDEDERGSRARLMKVKEMMLEEQMKQKRTEMFGEED
ncbi:MAG: V-type ATP synthase subunit D [Clostridia bacterium]|nr:V-type ATP synthase subunit D [Clostridia bacterium]